MPEDTAQTNLKRYLPHATVATFAVVGFPLFILSALSALWPALPPLFGTALGIALSVAIASLASAAWTRHRQSKDIVFRDLMLWGWLQRLHLEKRFSEVTALLGEKGTGHSRSDVVINPKRQAKTLKQLASALEARDPYTHGHTRRVTRYSYMTAKKMGLPKEEVKKLRVAAAVHDVGKLNIPNEVLHKPGQLTQAEFALVKEHAPRGAEMVSRIGDDEITAMVQHHHERLDGKGYPDGLTGAQIPLGARIIAVADTFDAITSTRSYRPGCTHSEAIEILKQEAGSQLDARAVNAFTSYYRGRLPVALWATLTAVPQRLLEALSRFSNGGTAGAFQAAAVAAVVAVGSYGGPLKPSADSDPVAAANPAAVHQVSSIPHTYERRKTTKRHAGKNPSGSLKPRRRELHPVGPPGPAGPKNPPDEHEPASRSPGGKPAAGGSDESNGGSSSGDSGEGPGLAAPSAGAPGSPATGAPGSPATGVTGPGAPPGATVPGPSSDPKGCGHAHDGPNCKRNGGR